MQRIMSDERIAEILAGQTAIIAAVAERLFETQQLDREALLRDLYDLLEIAGIEKPQSHYGAPIKHLISAIETP